MSYIEVNIAGAGPDHLFKALAALDTAEPATGLKNGLLIGTCSKTKFDRGIKHQQVFT